MLIPQFSVRTYFLATVVLALFFVVLGCAFDGQNWARGVSVAVLSLVAAFTLYWLFFASAWGFAEGRMKRQQPHPQSPFAGKEPPKQIFPPVDLCLLLAAALSGLGTDTALAGSGGLHVLDGRRYGIQVEVDSQWINGNGYRPLRMRLFTSPPSASSTARKLRIVVTPRMYAEELIRVVDELELPAGRRSVEKVVRVPQNGVWTSCNIDVYEDGRWLRDMSGEVPGFSTSKNVSDWTELVPSMLVIDSDAPVWDERSGGFPPRYQNTYTIPDPTGLGDFGAPISNAQMVYSFPATAMGSATMVTSADPAMQTAAPATLLQSRPADLLVLGSVNLHPRQEIISTKNAPTDWTELTAADLIFISLNDARLLVAEDPAKWNAILDWTATGRTLCFYDVGSDWERLREVDELLEGTDESAWVTPFPDKADIGFEAITRDFNIASLDQPKPVANPPQEASFRLRTYQLGSVVAFAGEDPFLDQINFTWMLASLRDGDRSWLRRYGFSQHRENLAYWNWKIPGVGAPPVLMFLGLITAFAVVVGPINYFWLRRNKRLHLLLITVPLGGTVATALLLIYALLADGLHTRVRTRSFVYLDQPRQQAVTWSRQTYYSGMAPSEGLVLPESTVAVPFVPSPANDRSRSPGELRWIGGQSLHGAFIRARELQQYMLTDVSTNAARLEFAPGNPPTVTNELGGDVERLFVRLEDGEVYEGTEIAKGATAKLTPLDEGELARSIREALKVRIRLDPDEGISNTSYRPSYGLWTGVDYNGVAPNMLTSVLERSLSQAQTGRMLTPRSYLAVVRDPSWLPVGVDDARRQKCLDVVYGKW